MMQYIPRDSIQPSPYLKNNSIYKSYSNTKNKIIETSFSNTKEGYLEHSYSNNKWCKIDRSVSRTKKHTHMSTRVLLFFYPRVVVASSHTRNEPHTNTGSWTTKRYLNYIKEKLLRQKI